jgi:hypothetical protein
MNLKNIPLTAIRIDGGTQSRVHLDIDTVAEYAAALEEDGKEFPPVVVFNDGSDYWLGDGFHRYHGYLTNGRASIPADLRTGTKRDAILHAVGANGKHGLRRTQEDKRNAVKMLLADEEWSKLSAREIAKLCDVSHTFVSNVRNPPPAPPPPAPPAPPAPKPPAQPKPPQPPAGNTTPEGGNVATEQPADDAATEAESNAAIAHDDTDEGQLLVETQAELDVALRQLEAANADDLKAEAMKWQRVADVAQRRQAELMETVTKREADLKRYVTQLRNIGALVGEDDPMKVLAAVRKAVEGVSA